jgi:hypothetical protein
VAYVCQGVCIRPCVSRLYGGAMHHCSPTGGAHAAAMCDLTACMEKMVVMAVVVAVATTKRKMIATALVS